MIEGPEAFAIRVHTARLAVRSLDVQTYIWHADLTGMFLAQQLIDAADRGVKVRLLLDDMDARAKNAGLAALAAHPKIDVRLFNPFASRAGMLGLIGEGLTDFGRVNRRMHNKSWIADNRIALVGGRNIGDEYYGASDEVNFVDLDFAMIGPVVRDASASFDKYWNAPLSYPIDVLDPDSVSTAELDRLRVLLGSHARDAATSRYATALRADDAVKRLVAGDWPMQWSSTYTFVSDDPLKVTMTERNAQRSLVGAALLPLLKAAQTNITIISPCSCPRSGHRFSRPRGRVSRARAHEFCWSHDFAAVHGGYRATASLARSGVHVWVLKRSGPQGDSSCSDRLRGACTPRRCPSTTLPCSSAATTSTRVNLAHCEQGVLVENAVLASQLDKVFATQTSGQRAWQVTLKEADLSWSDGNESFDSDPQASAGKRFQAWLTRVLHLDALL